MTISSTNAFVLIGNGEFLPEAQLHLLCQDKIRVALDGAADRLQALGIAPHIVLGDFDSLKDIQAWKKKNGVEIVYAEDQNFTDLQKAIDFCDARDATRIDLLCVLGGRLDHTLSNVFVLKKKYRASRALVLHSAEQSLQYIETGVYPLYGKAGDGVGIFGFPKAVVTSQGLLFDMENYAVEFAGKESVANALVSEQAELRVEGEALLVRGGA